MKTLEKNGKTYAFTSVLNYAGIAEFSDGKMERMGYCMKKRLACSIEEMEEQIESFCDPSQISKVDFGNIDTEKWHLLNTERNMFAKDTKEMFAQNF